MEISLDELITRNIKSYLADLNKYWNEHPLVLKVLDRIYFSSQYSFVNLLDDAPISNFSNWPRPFPVPVNECSAEELYSFDFHINNILTLERYDIFDYFYVDSYESAVDKYPRAYFLLKAGFEKILDNIILSALGGYKKSKTGVYIKTVSDTTSIRLDWTFVREAPTYNLFNYSFPDVIVNSSNHEYIQRGDIRTFLFINNPSFNIFYKWSSDFMHNEAGQVIEVKFKTGEPSIYDTKNGFLVTNSFEKLTVWNHYISSLLNLYVIHFGIYEKWLISILADHPSDHKF